MGADVTEKNLDSTEEDMDVGEGLGFVNISRDKNTHS
jgi:hypothetical protein